MTTVDVSAERAVLGAVLSDAQSYFRIELTPEEFWNDAHRAIFAGMRQMFGRGATVDEITLIEHLRVTGCLDQAGGVSGVCGLSDGLANPGGIEGYAAIVRDAATKRRLHTLGLHLVQMAEASPADQSLDFAQQALASIASNRDGVALLPWDRLVEQEVKSIIKRSKDTHKLLYTGLAGLDHILHGFHAGEMVIAAARPGVGKTALATDVAVQACIRGHKVALFSAEMTRSSIVARVLAGQAKIANWQVQRAIVNDNEIQRLVRAADESKDYVLWIDSRSRDVGRIRSRCRQLKLQTGLDLVIVDYLQRLTPAGKAWSREHEVASISAGLKDIALDLEIPVVVASQFSRAIEQRQDSKPLLSDLRESGRIEQDADTVIALSTDDQGDERIVTARVLKQRNGPLGECKLVYVPAYNQFLDYNPGGENV